MDENSREGLLAGQCTANKRTAQRKIFRNRQQPLTIPQRSGKYLRCMRGKYLRLRKESFQKLNGNTRLGIVPSPTNQNGETVHQRTMVYSGRSCFSGGETLDTHRRNIALDLHKKIIKTRPRRIKLFLRNVTLSQNNA
jgi:hypothetical protein